MDPVGGVLSVISWQQTVNTISVDLTLNIELKGVDTHLCSSTFFYAEQTVRIQHLSRRLKKLNWDACALMYVHKSA